MTTGVRARIFAVGSTALLSLFACKPGEGESPSPSPTATATPSPAGACAGCPAPYGRWGIVVAFRDAKGACNKNALAGPPRIGACRGEVVTWRVYNNCGTAQTVQLTRFFRLDSDPGIPTPEEETYRERQPERSKPLGQPLDPLENSQQTVTVKPGERADLKLTVRRDARPGVYTYESRLGGNRDADQQIEIWP